MTMTERPTDTGRAIVAREDIEAAQAVIDAWIDARASVGEPNDVGRLPYLRGLITQAIADAHAQGYEQGITRGRRQIGNALRDLLDGEGL